MGPVLMPPPSTLDLKPGVRCVTGLPGWVPSIVASPVIGPVAMPPGPVFGCEMTGWPTLPVDVGPVPPG